MIKALNLKNPIRVVRIVGCAMFLAATTPLYAGVTVDSHQLFVMPSPTSSPTWNHTISTAATDTLMVVYVATVRLDPTYVTVTLDGTPLASLGNMLYMQTAPQAGSHTIRVSLGTPPGGGTDALYGGLSVVFSGANQTTPTGPPVLFTTISGTNVSASLPSATGDMILWIAATAYGACRPALATWAVTSAAQSPSGYFSLAFGARPADFGVGSTTVTWQVPVNVGVCGVPWLITPAIVIKPSIPPALAAIKGHITLQGAQSGAPLDVRLTSTSPGSEILTAGIHQDGNYEFTNLDVSATYALCSNSDPNAYVFSPPCLSITGLQPNETRQLPDIAVRSAATSTPAPASIPSKLGALRQLPNMQLKGQLGRFLVAFPKGVNVSGTPVQIFPAGGQKAVHSGVGSQTQTLAPGIYDVMIGNVRVPNIPIMAGQDTQLQVGALRVTASNQTVFSVLSEDGKHVLAKGFGKQVLGLPVGRYAVKIGKGAGTFTEMTIEDGKISEFPPASSQSSAGSGGMAATGVVCVAGSKTASYLSPAVKIRGVCSPASENPNHEPDPLPVGVPTQHSLSGIDPKAAIRTKRLMSTDEGKQIVQQAAQRLGGFQMHAALLGGHTYMVNSCLGIKASAGTFDLSVPPPAVTFGATSATVSFTVSHIALEAFTVRLRPDPSDVIQPCHFSGRIGIGGAADQVSYSMTLDPLYDYQSCKITSMNLVNAGWHIGSFSIDPIPPAVTGAAKDMVVDALDYFSGFGLHDLFQQNLVDLLTSSTCQALQ